MMKHNVANSIPGGGLKNKGFTLIELIAILVLLGVIALITTPIIINITSRAEENTRVVSIIKYAEATKLAYTEELDNLTGKDLKELANLKMVDDKIVKCDGVVYTDSLGSILYDCTVNDMGNYCYLNGNVYNNTDNCNSIKEIAITGKIPYLSPEIVEVNKYPIGYEYSQNKDYKVSFPSIVVAEEFKYIRVSENINVENVVSYCNSGNIPENCIPTNDTLLEPNIWYEVSGDVTFNSNKNIGIDALIGKAGNYDAKTRYVEEKIDTTSAISDFKYTTLTDKIVLTESCNDPESGITKYEYKINDGEYKVSKDGSYVFNKLTSNTKYNVSIRCTNGSGLSSEKTKIITTNIVKPPVITITSKVPSSGYSYYQNVTLTITYDDTNMDTSKYYYSLDGKNWVETSKVSNVTLKENKTLYAKTTDNINTSKYATYTVTNIDMTKPNIKINVSNIKTDRVTLALTCSDTESGITKYEYSKDNGSTWVTGSNSYTFTGLTQGTSYKYVGRCTNGSGLSNTSSSTNTTNTIPTPVITQVSQEPSTGTWAISRTLRITYNNTNVENAKYYYSYDRINWTLVTSLSVDLKFTKNGYLYAKTTDGTNTVSTTAYTIANIDTTKPSITMKVSTKTDRATLTLTCSDTESGITKYEYSKDNGTSWVTGGNSYTYTGLTQGTSYKYVGRCTNGSGLTNTAGSTNTTNTITNPTIVQASQNPSSGTWAVSRTIRITYYNTNIVGARYYYSYNGSDWIEVSGTTDLTFTSNSLLYAKTTDASGNYKTASTYTVTNIESSDPSIPSITYNGGSNTCSWKNNYNLTLSSSASSGIAYYEIDVDNNGTSDGTTGSNFIPSNGWSTCSARFRAVTNAGRRSGWTDAQHIHMDTTGPSTPSITYNGGSNTCTWKNNYNLTLSSSDNIGVSYYQIDVDGNGTADRNINSNWIPENGFHSHNVKFRAVDYAGNVSGWTSGQHIHMDTTTPTITLNDLPSIINYKDNYKLPSSYSFGAGGGNVSCTVNGTYVTNTSGLRPAAYPVYCTATSSSGLSTTIRKDIQVKPVIDLSGIPDDFYSGASYSIPTAVNYGDHGGSTVCKINGTVVTNTNILTGGTTYWIECTATTAQGVVNSTKKIVTVRPSIDLSGIPASFKAGSSYSIPSQPVNYGVQGGSTVCKINGTVVTNTNILTGGSNYVINCTAVSNYKSITGTASKTIYVYN